ncbi:phosphotransferase family protein [Bacillus sp. AK128]
MESRTKNRQNREVIDAMVRRGFNGVGIAEGVDALTELKEGWFNVAYKITLTDGRETILKIAPPLDAEILTYEKNIMFTEVNMMKLVARETEVRVPEVFYYDQKRDLCDSDYFFMEKLSGSNYDHKKKNLSEEINSSINTQIGKFLKQINSIKGTSYFGYEGNPELRGKTWREAFSKMISSVLEDGERKQVDLGCSYDELYALIERKLDYLKVVTTPQLIHWDCWDGNVFVKDGKVVGIIDFERALWGDALMESLFRWRNPHQLAGYEKQNLTFEEEVRSKLYDLYMYLIMLIECEYRHYSDDGALNFSSKGLANTIGWFREKE